MADDIRTQLARALLGMTDGSQLPIDQNNAAQMQAFNQAANPAAFAQSAQPQATAPQGGQPLDGQNVGSNPAMNLSQGSGLPNAHGLTPEQIDAIRKEFYWLLPDSPKQDRALLPKAIQPIPNSNVRGIDLNQAVQNY